VANAAVVDGNIDLLVTEGFWSELKRLEVSAG
jgi:hypothetical protein